MMVPIPRGSIIITVDITPNSNNMNQTTQTRIAITPIQEISNILMLVVGTKIKNTSDTPQTSITRQVVATTKSDQIIPQPLLLV